MLSQCFAEIVGPEFVHDAAEANVIDGVRTGLVVEPGTPSEVASVLAVANEHGWQVIPLGGGTKLGWGNSPRSLDVVLSLRRLNRVLEHAVGDMTATVEAGCTIAALQQQLAQQGQRLALDPLWPAQATVGGVLATANSGSLRWAFGPPRDLVLGITVALADGTLARSGGKVVKNVAGYDLPKLFTGSFGTLGVITQATFRLHPLPAAVRDLSFRLERKQVEVFIAALRSCSLVSTAVQIEVADHGPASAFVRVEGLPDSIETKVAQVMQTTLAAGAELDEAAVPPDIWSAGERLFDSLSAGSVVAKVAILPTHAQQLLTLLEREATPGVRWQFVLQGYGVGYLRLDAEELDATLIERLRAGIVSLGGSLVILACSAEWKRSLSVWGEPGDALELMRRVKQQFDPQGILNRGRFYGGL